MMRCLLLLTLLSAACAQTFVNGNIYTGDPKLPRACGIEVKDGRVVRLITKCDVPVPGAIDLGDRFVMPGFNDAHVHLAGAGFEKLNVNLSGTKSLEEMQARIADRVQTAKPGEWIIGRGWDHTAWPTKQLPSRADLDKVTGAHPAIFTRVDGHIAVANSAALKSVGVDATTRPPEGGSIDIEQGEATGILRETAMRLVNSKVPAPTKEQRRRALELAIEEAVRNGVTSVQDNSSWDDFLIYEEMLTEGKLSIRISEWLPFDAPVERLKEMRAHRPANDPWLRTGMLKGVMDGTLGSRTAAMLHPYSDDPKNSGLPRYAQPQLNAMTKERVAAGFQLGFHAIGDRALAMALESFAQSGAGKNARLRIEHAQAVDPKHFRRMRDLGVIASMQPNHLLTDMNWAEERLGRERAKTSYPWRQFLENGVRLAFGTDYPVEPIDPFRTVYAAVTRMNEAGREKYPGDQAISIDQAIAAYTTGSAYAEFAERDKGTLAPGMWADFIVLDRDITKVKPAEILGTKVLRTVVAGKLVYEAK